MILNHTLVLYDIVSLLDEEILQPFVISKDDV